jgi:hypothetical protein
MPTGDHGPIPEERLPDPKDVLVETDTQSATLQTIWPMRGRLETTEAGDSTGEWQ